MDALGKLCAEGKQAAEYLWQVPKDEKVRAQIVEILEKIAALAKEQGRHEMGRIVDELSTAAKASPSPQQVDLLVDGFDRMSKLWQAAKSGLM
jgi:nucleotide-binding universal stress UspA family protein